MRPFKSVLIPTLLCCMTVLALVASYWQWQRGGYHDRLAMVSGLQQGSYESPNITSGRIANVGLVQLVGRWLPNSTTFVSPRIVDGQVGAWPVAVFQITQSNGATVNVPVHLGWMPQTSPTQPPTLATLPQGEQTLVGYATAGLSRVYELKSGAKTQLGLWQNYDATAHGLILSIPLSPSIFVLTQAPANDTAAFVLRRTLPETQTMQWQQRAQSNRGYAFQWAGLAFVGMFGLAWMWKKRS